MMLQRRMTLDFGEHMSNKDGLKAADLASEADRSQLTVETEQMMPLAAADCLLNTRSLSMVSDQQNIMRRASIGEESKGGSVSQDLN